MKSTPLGDFPVEGVATPSLTTKNLVEIEKINPTAMRGLSPLPEEESKNEKTPEVEMPKKTPKTPKKAREALEVPYTLANLELMRRSGLMIFCATEGCRAEIKAPMGQVLQKFESSLWLGWVLGKHKDDTFAAYCPKHKPSGKKFLPIVFVEETF